MAARRSRSFRASAALLALFAFAVWSASGAQAGTCTCPLPSHSVSQSAQSGPSVCLAAQDERGCALQMLSVPQPGAPRPKAKDGTEAPQRPRAPGPDGALRLSLDEAFQVAPQVWTSREFDAVIRAVASIAERRLGADGMAGVEAALRGQAETLRQVFTDISYERRVEYVGAGSYDALVSYGCLEVTRGSFIAIIRAPFTAAGRRCNAF